MTKPTLQVLFGNLQTEMKTKLEVGRECINHSTEKGNDSELHWKEWFNNYLPKRYQTEKAFIIDSKGNQSDQIDLVIYDNQYSPLIFKHGEFIYIPAESVYAIFEVKQNLNKNHIEYAKRKAASVRALHRTSVPIPHAGGIFKPLPPKPIFAGILTYNCDWDPPFGNPFQNALKTYNANEKIDFGCAICNGGFETNYINGKIEKSEVEYSLVFFFLKLLSRLQSIGTVTALDISEYLKVTRKE